MAIEKIKKRNIADLGIVDSFYLNSPAHHTEVVGSIRQKALNKKATSDTIVALYTNQPSVSARQPHTRVSPFLFLFSLYEEYVVRFPLPDVFFLPCDHGLDFLLQLM